MVQILPFRGVRYGTRYAQGYVYSPPFDVIDAAQRQCYLARSPYNVVRLTLGPSPEDRGWHDQAATTMARWLAEGVLEREPVPALYGYRQHFALADGRPRVRTGYLGRVRLAEWGQGVHRHERTKAGPRSDRLCLTRATRANMSPVFGLYPDPTGELKRWLEPPARPLVDVRDEDDVRHLFWRIEEPAVISTIADAMGEKEVIVADGHHRYETALAYRDERRAAENDPPEPRPYDYVLMYLTAIEDPGLTILASHRLVSGALPDDEQHLLQALASDFELSPHAGERPLAEVIAQVGEGTIVMGLHLRAAGAWLLKLKDMGRARRASMQLPEELATLDVSVLHNLVLRPHLGITPEVLAETDRVTYTIDETEARHRVRVGKARAAFILNPTSVDQVWRAARRGVAMPQKSTYFYPKLLTGLVFNPLDEK